MCFLVCLSLGFIGIVTSQEMENGAPFWCWAVVTGAANNFYFHPLISPSCFNILVSIVSRWFSFRIQMNSSKVRLSFYSKDPWIDVGIPTYQYRRGKVLFFNEFKLRLIGKMELNKSCFELWEDDFPGISSK